MAAITLNIAPVHYEAVKSGLKTAELRLNDRDFKVGDWLILKEWDNGYSGRQVSRKVAHIADVGDIVEGYVLISII